MMRTWTGFIHAICACRTSENQQALPDNPCAIGSECIKGAGTPLHTKARCHN
ncbi:uncharacterized protein RCC_01665 [Ramularia collo-cygni]|uniref:Uncharacterized protein n=1 Tax=Ramularia collo-cygni TaxID=112498 RepID=A0A2D3V2U3_9PEZI|nr:uncharacterized protein RCC_01665 [Ramularia collo-cygni]CZT15829.1 uncharacterized protein RCC_01665 [Ramularia collo-cygni]